MNKVTKGVFTPESPHQGPNQSSRFDTFCTFRKFWFHTAIMPAH